MQALRYGRIEPQKRPAMRVSSTICGSRRVVRVRPVCRLLHGPSNLKHIVVACEIAARRGGVQVFKGFDADGRRPDD